MRAPGESGSLECELDSNQALQLHSRDDDVAPQNPGRFARQAKSLRHQIENLAREKSDLTLVVVAVIEEAVAANPVAGDALDLMGFDKRKIIRRPAVMAKIVVIGRNEYLLDDHAGTLPYP